MDREERVPADVGAAGSHGVSSDLLGSSAWDVILQIEAARCLRYGGTATVLVMEVPGLDGLAAAWGPDVLEVALTRLGAVLRAAARSSDYVARLADGRFAALLPETDEVAAVNFVERARERCDAAMTGAPGDGRCRFGWADVRPSRPLDIAVDLAVSRLASDR